MQIMAILPRIMLHRPYIKVCSSALWWSRAIARPTTVPVKSVTSQNAHISSSRRRLESSKDDILAPNLPSSTLNDSLSPSTPKGPSVEAASSSSTAKTKTNQSLADLAEELGPSYNRYAPSKQAPRLNPTMPRPHHLHIYAHKHNTHITLTTGARNAVISMSTGQLKFKKHQRGTFEAAYQLALYVLAQMRNRGLFADGCDPKVGPIRHVEVIFRGFGSGREAVGKVLLGEDATLLRNRVIRVMDSTRVKFGGTRGKKRRRIG